MRFRLHQKLKFPLIFGLGCICILALSFLLVKPEHPANALTLLGAFGGIVGFLYAQHAQDLQVFRDLFRDFNERYDDLNERLNGIRDRSVGEPLRHTKEEGSKSDIEVLYEYFNLCAEEYIYGSAGYLDERVWKAWKSGMRYFADDPEIGAFWEEELTVKKESYYDFSLSKIGWVKK